MGNRKKNSGSWVPDSIYVTSKPQKAVVQEDAIILALKLVFPQRQEMAYEPALKDLPKAKFAWAITLESKNHSVVFLVHPQKATDAKKIRVILEGLRDKLLGVIKSTHEKVYFMDVMNLKIDDTPLEAVISSVASYSFMTPMPGFQACVGYFRMDKLNDEDRFLPMSLDLIEVEQPVDNDLYLRMRRNNRYIKYVNKGGRLERKQHERLSNKGVKDLFIPSDRPVNVQMEKLANFFAEVVKEFYRLGK